MTPIFEACLKYIFNIEGGFVDLPEDHGGPTNFGITQDILSRYRGFPATPNAVKNLSKDEASKIYELIFWNAVGLNRIQSYKIALFLFDQCVNLGPRDAIKLLQRVLNSSFSANLTIDGVLGQKTDAAICYSFEIRLIQELLQAAQMHYLDLALKDPKQFIFLKGWINRTHLLWDELS